ncbi:unnamed protein product [Caenorhabditis nigoni]|uniref:Protein kinase domain-containing protein n=1 Tax=Caenorhabditis nigoni TaxID=1611254 RepID=A0A2G5SNR8_9PELO|nr:hypothetical protein B9Z55_023085 [Caenorhabditis nigoni]
MAQPTINDEEEKNELIARYDRYRFVETSDIKEFGGFGTTHSVFDTMTNNNLVVKSQKKSFAFKRELAILKELKGDFHFPQFVECYGKVDPTLGMLYCIAMTIEGESIHRLASRTTTRWSNANCVRLLFQLFEAVEALHNHGYCHRDIHSGNVTIKRETNGFLRVKLIDFNVALKLNPPPHPTCDLTSWQASLQVCQGMPYTCFDDLTSAVFILFKVLLINPFGAQGEWKEKKEAFHQHPHAWFGEDTMWIPEMYIKIQEQRSRGVDYSGLLGMLEVAVPGVDPQLSMEYKMTRNQIVVL